MGYENKSEGGANFRILSSGDEQWLANEVDSLMRQGWETVGGLAVIQPFSSGSLRTRYETPMYKIAVRKPAGRES